MPFTTSFTPLARATTARAEQVNAQLTAIYGNFALLPAPEKIVAGSATYGVESGAANAYVVTLTPAPSAYSEGMTVDFKAGAANTGASTINLNSLGLKSIRAYDGAELVAGQIPAGGIVTVRYDGTVFRLNNVVGVNIPEDGSVTTAKLVDRAVTEAKIGDAAVTAAKINDGAATNAKLADMAQATIKGRAAAAGTGDPTDLTPAQVLTLMQATLDARYAVLGASTTTFTGTVVAGSSAAGGLQMIRTGSARIIFTPSGDNLIHSIDAGSGSVSVATIAQAGATTFASNDAQLTVMTREKGDARYAQIASTSTFTANPIISNAQPEITLSETGQTGFGARLALQLDGEIGGIIFRDENNLNGVRVYRFVPDGSLNVGGDVVTRGTGDTRYTLASSSRRLKEGITSAIGIDLSGLSVMSWTWGGALSADDPRRGNAGYGLIAEDVAALDARLATYDDTGAPNGINVLAMIGALVAAQNALTDRVAALEV